MHVIHDQPIQKCSRNHTCSGVSIDPSVSTCLVPLVDLISAWKGTIVPIPFLLPLPKKDSGMAYSLQHYLFSYYSLFPRFSVECRIRERLSPMISLLFESLWWICQFHQKSNYPSWEVTGHLVCTSWTLKYCCQYAINCCFTLDKQWYFSIL